MFPSPPESLTGTFPSHLRQLNLGWVGTTIPPQCPSQTNEEKKTCGFSWFGGFSSWWFSLVGGYWWFSFNPSEKSAHQSNWESFPQTGDENSPQKKWVATTKRWTFADDPAANWIYFLAHLGFFLGGVSLISGGFSGIPSCPDRHFLSAPLADRDDPPADPPAVRPGGSMRGWWQLPLNFWEKKRFIPKNHEISKLGVWRSLNPAIQIRTPL